MKLPVVSFLLLFLCLFSSSYAHAWNYTLTLKKEKKVAVVLGVFGHTEFGKTQVSITNLILEPAKQQRPGEQQQVFTAKAWLELRKVKSITAAKKLKKQIEKDEIESCLEIENSRLGQDDDDGIATTVPVADKPATTGFLPSPNAGNKAVMMKSYLRYLKAQPHEEEDDLKATITFTTKEAGLYALFLARCISPGTIKAVASAKIAVSQYNPKYSASGNGIEVGSTYLPVGETPLPTLYGGFGLIFAVGTFFWFRELSHVSKSANSSSSQQAADGGKPVSVMKIHYAMLLVGALKTLTLFLESGVYAHRNTTGATGATVDVVFVLVAAAKTAILFIIIILLGTGWSISKAVVTEREQKLILGVLIVQIVVNIALASLEEGAPVGVETVEKLRLGLRILDVLCALLVLIPIILRAKSHHETSVMTSSSAASPPPPRTISTRPGDQDEELEKIVDGEDQIENHDLSTSSAHNSANERELHRLRTFRTFYITTFIFLYFTRLVVPYLEKHLSYLFVWISHLLYELAALVFYYMSCKLFHPQNLNVAAAGAKPVVSVNTKQQKVQTTSRKPEEMEEVDLS